MDMELLGQQHVLCQDKINRHEDEIGICQDKIESLHNRVSVVEEKMSNLDLIREDIKIIKESLKNKFIDSEIGRWLVKFSAWIIGLMLLCLAVGAIGINVFDKVTSFIK